jgi:hypothetical protein
MRRREFIGGLGGAAAGYALALLACGPSMRSTRHTRGKRPTEVAANPQLLSDFVQKGFLPQNRAGSCRSEYNEVNCAFHQVIGPHLDPKLAKMVWTRHGFRLQHRLRRRRFSLRASPLSFGEYVNVCSNFSPSPGPNDEAHNGRD